MDRISYVENQQYVLKKNFAETKKVLIFAVEKYKFQKTDMKFTKEQAVESITAKFTDKAKGIDLARTIDEAVSNGIEMVGENSEMELNAFVGIVEKNVSSALGLARHLKNTETQSLQEKIAELEKKVPKTEPKQDPKTEPEPNSEIKALLDRIEALEKDKADNAKATKIAEKRNAIAAKIKELGVSDEKWVNTMLDEVSITEDTDVEKKSKDYVALYNSSHSSTSITPKVPGAPSADKIDLSGLDDALKQIRGDFGKPNDNKN